MNAASSSSASKNALHLYRRLIDLAKRLPSDKQASALQQIRQGFRENSTEKDEQR